MTGYAKELALAFRRERLTVDRILPALESEEGRFKNIDATF